MRRVGAVWIAATLIVSAFSVHVRPAAAADLISTATTLAVPANPVGIYDAFTVVATVDPNPGGGWVSFYRDGSLQLGSPVDPDGTARYELPDGTWDGTHTFAARFEGTVTHASSLSEIALVEVVDDRAPIQVTVTTSPNPSLRGDPVDVHVEISPNPGGGDVYLTGVDPEGVIALDKPVEADGTVEFVWRPTASVDVSFKACFSGTDRFQDTCSSPITQSVRSFPTTTLLEVVPGTIFADDALTLRVTVSPVPEVDARVRVGQYEFGPGWSVGIPAGEETGELTLPGSVVEHDLDVGAYSFRAWYEGTPHTDASVSDPVELDVLINATTTTVSVDPAAVATAPATIDVRVSPAPPVDSMVWVWIDFPADLGVGYGAWAYLDETGHDSLTLDPTGFPEGDWVVKAEFRGSTRYAPSAATTRVLTDSVAPVGSVEINGGAGATNATAVSVDVSATDFVGVRDVALSNDGSAWTLRSYSATQAWALPAGNGPRAVSVKWRDSLGNWSAAKTDTIVLDTAAPAGSVSIASGAAYTKSTAVTISTGATDATSGVTHVALSNDGTTWTTRTYAASQPWTLTATNGTKTVWAKWKDAAGNWSAAKTDTIVLDTAAPAASGPSRALATGTISSGKAPVKLAWTGSDATAGVARYELRQQTDGGSWTTVSTTLTATSLTRSLAPGHTYRFGVRAVDKAGNVGAWASGATFRVSAYQESSTTIRYSGTWATGSSTSYWGGKAKSASAAGAKATFTFTGRSVGWVSLRAPSRGVATVYVDGTKVATVDLYATSTQGMRVVWSKTWSTLATRTVTIRVSGTAGRPKVPVDAFVTGS